ncbi:MAG: DUF493 domain-containing protein [Gammaproteobacteria bacterium]|nr:DUF493 domain-containing protein [Gammaproteobacteria bacterium]
MPDSNDSVNDGFDLLEYPCRYAFKAMCQVSAIDGDAGSFVSQLVLQHLPAAAVHGVSSNLSRTGKFESITITVTLSSRSELEQVYQALADSKPVKMTL